MTQAVEAQLGATRAPMITIALLGPVRVARGGAPVTFAYEKVLALLIFLAVESGRSHRRAALADLLWPDQGDAAARHNLSQALFNLRRALPDDPGRPLLLATRDSVRLNPAGAAWVDLADFRSLAGDPARIEEAAALYRGEFLEGLSISGSAGFDEWCLLTREQLRAQICDLLRRLSDPRGGAPDPARRVAHARRWVGIDPLDEAAHRRLMRALAESGQRSAALLQYEQCRRLLASELGIAPDPETHALLDELRQRTAPPPPAQGRPAPASLPQPPNRLIGRDLDLAALTAQIAAPGGRLITITGPGGVGKTRLALAAAAASAESFPDGVSYAQLAPIRDPERALAAIAQAIGVPQGGAQPLDTMVHSALAPRRALLLLDNCEQLLPAMAALVGDLLASAPELVILATSRAPLRLSQERRHQLAPLSLPDERQPPHLQAASPAVALFVERARSARPAAELDLADVGALCRRLDGLPLAIELAATRSRLLSPRELLARLGQRLPLLTGGPADLPERQQTMHATIDWSYRLLDPGQQAILARLAVFSGGWGVAAAEAVCAAGGRAPMDVLDGLTALLDASLIHAADDQLAEPRCDMLETIREYAADRLAERGELDDARRRHAQHYVALGAQAAPALSGPEQRRWLQRLDAEHENLRAALGWCAVNDSGAGLRLASDISRYWVVRGLRREGRDWLELLLASTGQGSAPAIEDRAYGLLISGMLAMFLNELDDASERLRESLALYQRLEDQAGIAWVLNNLGNVALQRGAYPEAQRHYEESLALRRALGQIAGMASSLNNLGGVALAQRDLAAARSAYEQSMLLYQQAGDQAAAASAMGHLATILLQQGDHARAEQLYAESHAIAQELGDKPGLRQTRNGLGNVARAQGRRADALQHYRSSLEVAIEIQHLGGASLGLIAVAALGAAEGRAERAALLFGAAEALIARAKIIHNPEDLAEFAQQREQVRGALGAAAFTEALARGRLLSLEQAAAIALGDG